jgi:hypothetical protein
MISVSMTAEERSRNGVEKMDNAVYDRFGKVRVAGWSCVAVVRGMPSFDRDKNIKNTAEKATTLLPFSWFLRRTCHDMH